jgi:3-deoxy-manno-octulosonate cytidylyltransferase (CMP-KDO synthetase)
MKSTRFPGKVLADIHGWPMLRYVHQAVSKAKRISGVWVLTDSQEVLDVASSWGAKTLMTAEDCPSGTDRIASVIDLLEGEIIINVQADEPLINSDVVDHLVLALENSAADVATPVYPITTLDELTDPNVVKVVRALDGSALYFSRSPVPYVRDAEKQDWLSRTSFWGHAGVYAYRRSVLLGFLDLPEGRLETVERLEQLRLLEAGKRILAVEIDYRPHAVDVPSDLEEVKRILEATTSGPWLSDDTSTGTSTLGRYDPTGA